MMMTHTALLHVFDIDLSREYFSKILADRLFLIDITFLIAGSLLYFSS